MTASVSGSCLQCRVGRVSAEGRQLCPFTPRQRRAEELIYLQGDPATGMWCVKSGVVVLRRADSVSRGRGTVRCIRVAGGLVGVEALVGDRYVDTAEAGTDVTLCAIACDDVDRWIGARTPARALLEASLQASLDDGVFKSAAEGTVVERVAGWYLDHVESTECLSLSRRIVADLLGVRPETLSRALAGLQRLGALRITRSSVVIVDRDRLGDARARG